MKKFLSILLVLLVALTVAACNGKDKDKTTGPSGTTTAEDTTQKPGANDTVVEFATWGFGTQEENNLLRRRVKAFNDLKNGIFIKIVEPEGNWDEWLNTKASANQFPDVLALGNVPSGIINEWVGSITDLVKNDSDWNDIPEALRDSVTYLDQVYAIPSAYHYLGYFANIDLIESTNKPGDFENFDYTIEQFLDVIKSLKDTTGKTDGSGTIGISNTYDFVNWLPAAYNESLSHFVYTGSGFDFTGTALSNAMRDAAQLVNSGYTFNAFSDAKAEEESSERELIFGDNWDGAVFRSNQMGFTWGGSWDEAGLVKDIGNKFLVDFVGTPGGNVVGVSDYYGISKTAKNREAAYTVAKYLTFGKDGINKAFDIIKDAKEKEDVTLVMAGLPINESEAIVEKWFATHTMPGFKKAYEKAAAGEVTVLMEGNKYIPGFLQARFDYDTGVEAQISRPNEPEGKTLSIGDLIWDAAGGKITNFSEVMTKEIEDLINAVFDEALEAVTKQIQKDHK